MIMSKFFNNQIYRNNLYFLLTAIMFVFTALLNVSNKLVFCSFIFVLIAFITNFMSELYGKKKTMYAIILCVLVNAAINNINISITLFGSLLSVVLSTYCSISLFLKFESSYSFHIRNFMGLILCSFIDCAIMASFLISKFSASQVLSMFTKDIAFKFTYSITISCCLILIFYLSQQFKNLKKAEF